MAAVSPTEPERTCHEGSHRRCPDRAAHQHRLIRRQTAWEAQATEKKLWGAAKSSFMKKCDKDAAELATRVCTDQATEKKLAGAVKSIFVKKCVKDTTAAK
ncbi:MAG: hypothetical protein H6R11_1349 [Proteobacteria bacterium]|nr:hypothetical protein [Pseudomonadota bacterium]